MTTPFVLTTPPAAYSTISGPGAPPDAPLENVKAMANAAEDAAGTGTMSAITTTARTT
jgi:hypothetical protein